MNIDNPKIWSLTDGSQDMISQTKGLANELSVDIRELKTEIIFPWNKLQPGILPIFSWIFKNKLPTNLFKPVYLITVSEYKRIKKEYKKMVI